MKKNIFLQAKAGLFLAVLYLLLSPAPGIAGEALPSQLRGIMENPSLLRGDSEGAIRYWLEAVRKSPDSVAAELALRMISSLAPIDLPRIEPFEPALEQYLAGNPGNGCAADAARRLLAKWRAKRGEFSSARKLEEEGAVLTDWLVAGPFGHYAKANFDTAYPPEGGIGSLDKPLRGSRGEVRWRPLHPDPFTSAIQPYEAIHPTAGAALYLLAQLRIKSNEEAFLQVDCPDSWKLWVNGRLVKTVNRLAAYLPRETFVAIPGPGRGGWKQLLFKIYSPSGDTKLRVRLTGADGVSLPGHAYAIDNSVFHPYPQAAQQAETATPEREPAWFLPALERAAEEFTEEPSVHGALAMAYHLQGIPDRARAEARLALEKDGGTVYSHLLAAQIEAAAFHLPRQSRANNSRRHYAAALALDPSCIPAALALAGADEKDGSPRAALERIEKLLRDNPGCRAALRLRARLALDLDWNEAAERWTGEYANRAPESLGVALLQARTSLRFQRLREVAAAYDSARRADQSERLLWLAQLKALGRLGDRAGADRLAEELFAIAPQSVAVLERLARHYLRFGEFAKAVKIINHAVKILPADERLWRLKGDILIRAGGALAKAHSTRKNNPAVPEQKRGGKSEADNSALAAYQKSLKLSPSQHGLRGLIARLQSSSAAEGIGGIGNTGIPRRAFWSADAIDPAKALRDSQQQEEYGSTVRLIDQTVMQIYADGSRQESTHQLHKVLTESGIPLARQVPIFGEILEARTILPYGQTMEPIILAGKNTLTMPQLRPGAAVEYRFLSSTPARQDYGFYGPAFYFRSPDLEEKFILSQYIVRVPNQLPFAYVRRNGAPPPKIERGPEETTYRWTMTNTERVWHEDNMPQIKEFLPYVEIASKKTWGEVAKILKNAYLGRLRPTVEMRDLVRQLVGGEEDPRRRTEILYRYVMDNIKESNMPGEASIILARQSGERLPLLLALLRMAGIDARFAALRPNREVLFAASWEMPMAEYFQIYALAVFLPQEENPLWLDTRFRTIFPGQILEDLNGATAFVLNPEGGSFFNLPRLAPESFGADEKIRIKLDPDTLSGIAAGTRLVRGIPGADLKEILPGTSRRDRIRILERRLGRAFPLVTANKLTLPGLAEPGEPYREDYEVKVDRLLQEGKAGQLSLPLCFAPLDLVGDLDKNPRRRHNPYRLGQYLVGSEQLTFEIPAGYKAQGLPEPVTAKDFFGNYSLLVHQEDGLIKMTRRYVFTPKLVPKEDYPRLVGMARLIRKTEAVRIVLIPVGEPGRH